MDFYDEPVGQTASDDPFASNDADDVPASSHSNNNDAWDAPASTSSNNGFDSYDAHAHDSTSASNAADEPDDARFREWEAKHNEELIEKDGKEYDAVDALKRAAREEFVKFQDERAAKQRALAETLKDEQNQYVAQLESAVKTPKVWDGAVSLVDLQLKTERRDVSRMKQVLLRLKNETTA
jgi:hypothetical protein